MQQTKSKYITLKSGTDFRAISQIMTRNSFVMNHATARNVLMSAMHNFIMGISEELGEPLSMEEMEEILKDQTVHDSFTDILFKVYEELHLAGEI